MIHSQRPSLIRLNTAISETLSLDMPPITEDTSVQPVILVWRSPSTYGPYLQHQRKKPLLAALINMVIIFSVSLIFMIISLKLLLPPIDEADKQYVKIPKSFDDLKDLNKVLQIYKERNGFRVVGSFTIVYLFLQAFSLPGSMYLSILAGAMYGFKALFLVCACVASGASLCYLLSASLGPALLLASSKWRNRLEAWRTRTQAQNENLISYLIVLRIAPLPPHWVVNAVAPHLGVTLPMFWISTFLGVMGVSYIHVSIGGTLDEMTSSADFHLISVKNVLGLAGIIAAVLIPVLVRYAWKEELSEAAKETGAIALPPDLDTDNDILINPSDHKITKAKLVFLDQNGQEVDRTLLKTDHLASADFDRLRSDHLHSDRKQGIL